MQRFNPAVPGQELTLGGAQGLQVFVPQLDGPSRRRTDSGQLADALKVFADEGLAKKAEGDEEAFQTGKQAFIDAQVAIAAGDDEGAVLERLSKKLGADPVALAPFQRGVSTAKGVYGINQLQDRVNSVLADLVYEDEHGAPLSNDEMQRKFAAAYRTALNEAPYLNELRNDPFVGEKLNGAVQDLQAIGTTAVAEQVRATNLKYVQDRFYTDVGAVFELLDGPVSEEATQVFHAGLSEIVAAAKRNLVPNVEANLIAAARKRAMVLSQNGEQADKALHFIDQVLDFKLNNKPISEREDLALELETERMRIEAERVSADSRVASRNNDNLVRAQQEITGYLAGPEVFNQLEAGQDPQQFLQGAMERLRERGVYLPELEGNYHDVFREAARGVVGTVHYSEIQEIADLQRAAQLKAARAAVGVDPAAGEELERLMASESTTPELLNLIPSESLTSEERRARARWIEGYSNREEFIRSNADTLQSTFKAIDDQVATLAGADAAVDEELQGAANDLKVQFEAEFVRFADELTRDQSLSTAERATRTREFTTQLRARAQQQAGAVKAEYERTVGTPLREIRQLARSLDLNAADSAINVLEEQGTVPPATINQLRNTVANRRNAVIEIRQIGDLNEGPLSEYAALMVNNAVSAAFADPDEQGQERIKLTETVSARVREMVEGDEMAQYITDTGLDIKGLEARLKSVIREESSELIREASAIKQFSYQLKESPDPMKTYYRSNTMDAGAARIVQDAIFNGSAEPAVRTMELVRRFDEVAAQGPEALFDVYGPLFATPDAVIDGQFSVGFERRADSRLDLPPTEGRRENGVAVPADVDWRTVPLAASKRALRDWGDRAGPQRIAQLLERTGFKTFDELVDYQASSGLLDVRAKTRLWLSGRTNNSGFITF